MDKRILDLIHIHEPSRDVENDILQYLRENPNPDLNLTSLLHRGIYNKFSLKYIKELVELGADPSGRRGGPREGWRGRLPIESAIVFVSKTCFTIIRMLISMGADVKSIKYVPPALHKLAFEADRKPCSDDFEMINLHFTDPRFFKPIIEHTFVFDLLIWNI